MYKLELIQNPLLLESLNGAPKKGARELGVAVCSCNSTLGRLKPEMAVNLRPIWDTVCGGDGDGERENEWGNSKSRT